MSYKILRCNKKATNNSKIKIQNLFNQISLKSKKFLQFSLNVSYKFRKVKLPQT